MTLQILVDDNIPAAEHYLGGLGEVRYFAGRHLQPAQLAGVDVLLVRSVTRVDSNLLGDSPVRFVGSATSGVDHVDRHYLAQRGTGFAHAPGANANSVVEYVLAAIGAVGGHLERLLAGGRVGIIGYGNIGRALASRLQALDIPFLACDPWLEPGTVRNGAELSAVLGCEVVTLHPELTREQPWPSYHLLDRRALEQLNEGCLLINASRGPVVDNDALLARLSARGDIDVVLDVWEGEPDISASLLERVAVGTAHIAGYSYDGKLLATRMLCQAMADHLGLPWQPPGNPAGEAPGLELGEGLEEADLVRHLLSVRYDIMADDAALRAATLGRPDRAAAFDALRGDYPRRRELLGTRVLAAGVSPRALLLIAGLGCRAVAAGGSG